MVKKMISIIAPMYNEENLVFEFFFEVYKVANKLDDNIEIVFVNDGSTDSTYEKMLSLHHENPELVTVVSLTRNFGLEGAVFAGLRKAKGDAVVVMDADLQDPPDLIIKMVEKWKEGFEIVTASRHARPYDGFFKKLSAKFYYAILDELAGKLKMSHHAANFRLLSRRAVDNLLSLPEVQPVFRVLVPYIGMKTTEVEYTRQERYSGQTKYNLCKMIPYALNSITGISVQPLRWISLLMMCPISTLLIWILILSTKEKEYELLLFILGGTISIIGASILVALAIIAEYIAQIMVEAKGRPISMISEYLSAKGDRK